MERIENNGGTSESGYCNLCPESPEYSAENSLLLNYYETNQDEQNEDSLKTEKNAQPPLKYCSLIDGYPVTFLVVTLVFHSCIILLTVVLLLLGNDVFPVDFQSLPLVLYDDPRHTQDLAWRSAKHNDSLLIRAITGKEQPNLNGLIDYIEITFTGDNILSEKNLILINKTEGEIFNYTNSIRTFCLLNLENDCQKPASIMRLFDGSYKNLDPAFDSRSFANAESVICKALTYNMTKPLVEPLLEKNYNPCRPNQTPSKTRLFVLLGWSRVDHYNDYTVVEYLVSTIKPELEKIKESLDGRISLYYYSVKMFIYDVEQEAFANMKLAIGSFCFIFIFMIVQTSSVWITCFGILSIITSFLLTNLIYRYVLQYQYFGYFHIISICVILGIGADDVFIFYDTWRLSESKIYPSKAHRLSECYRHAAKTTFVTSLTTMAAFLVSARSPLLPVSSFGLFSGMLIGVNYIFDLLCSPIVIMVYSNKVQPLVNKIFSRFSNHRTYKKGASHEILTQGSEDHLDIQQSGHADTTETIMVCGHDFNSSDSIQSERQTVPKTNAHMITLVDIHSRPQTEDDSDDNLLSLDNDEPGHPTNWLPNRSEASADTSHYTTSMSSQINQEDSDDELLIPEIVAIRGQMSGSQKTKSQISTIKAVKLISFLTERFYKFMMWRPARVSIQLFFLAITIFFIYSVTTMEISRSQVQVYRDSHNYAQAIKFHYTAFQSNYKDEYTKVHLSWGLKPQNMASCNRKSAEECNGEPEEDELFSLASEEAQISFMNLCIRLENLTDKEISDYKIKRNSVTNLPEISCFMSSLYKYIQSVAYPRAVPFPFTREVVILLMKNISHGMPSLPKDFNSHFEILIAYWLSNGYSGVPTQDFWLYKDLIGEKLIPGMSVNTTLSIDDLLIGTKLRYVGIEINTTLNIHDIGYIEGKPVYELWEKLIQNETANMPINLKGGFQSTKGTWHWIRIQEILVSSAKTGLIFGICLAFPILTVTTLNFVMGFIATVCIAMITVVVVGIIPLMGWKLGVLESINLGLVVGLSVDYVVHLAEAYTTSPCSLREGRVKNMLESMSLSVLSGAITTFGAATFMLFANIQFSFQFGIFVMSTVGISVLFSFFFFTAFMTSWGPQGNTGSISSLVTIIKTKVTNHKN